MAHRALSPSLFGREEQLGALEGALAQVRRGAGRVVFLAGEAGVGKTRLVQEFVRRLPPGAGVEVLRGHCFEEDPAEPYGPFVELLRALAQARGPEALAGAAGPWAGALGRLLPDVAAPAEQAEAEPQHEKRRLFEAIYRVLRPQDGRGCRVVVLEDLHWSDQTSQELVHFLARAIERDRVLLIGTYRADELHRRHPLTHLIARLSRERLYHEVRLAPLSRAELAQMLEAALGRRLPAAFVEALYERTEGNPFFAEEVLGALVEHGRLEALLQAAQERRRLELREIPLSVHDSILRRTADLDPSHAAVLRYAAVIGRRFDFDLLAHLTGLPEAGLVRSLAELVERQLVVEDAAAPAAGGEDRYMFRHALVREAVLEDLLRRERRMMHREVLLALEALPGDRPEAVDQLAYHSLQARELERAARYARQAGDRAVALCAYREAIDHYEAALEADAAAGAAARAELLTCLGHAAYRLGDVRRGAGYWREAHALYDGLGERRRAADLLRWLGRAAWELDDTEAAFAHTRAALATLEGEPPCHELAMAYSALSHLHMLTEAHEESIAWGERALALAEQLGDDGVKAHALNNIGVSLCARDDHERGLEALERSLALARQRGLHLDTVRAYINLGGQHAHLGQFRRAHELYLEAVDYAECVGMDLRVILLFPKLAWVELLLGAWDQAQARIEQALRAADIGAPVERGYLLMQRAELLLRRGQAPAAAELVGQLDPRPPTPGDCWDSLNTTYLQALLHAAQGDMARAAAAVEENVRVWDVGGRPRKAIYQLTDSLEILLRAGRAPAAYAHLAAAETVLAGAGQTQVERAHLADAQGVTLATGDDPAAEERFRQAAELWHEIGLPFEEARSRRRLAAALLRRGALEGREEARRQLEAARALLEPLGAAPELELVDALQTQLTPARRPAAPRAEGLTPREREVLALLSRGASNRAIAEALVISEKTVEVHVSNILGKLGASSRTQAAALAREQGLAEAA